MSHEKHQNCIDACNACGALCDHCSVACLNESDATAMARCIQLDMDCAAICRLAAGYMARGSEFAKDICDCCAKVCSACADECAKHQMEHCQKCAEACRKCAEACSAM